MIILDTNVFIYIGNETLSPLLIADADVGYASVTLVEALGYPRIEAAEQRALQRLFDVYQKFDLSTPVIELAVELRQDKRVGLGDAIVAATALENDAELWTANTDDFKHINGLKLVNPFNLANDGIY